MKTNRLVCLFTLVAICGLTLSSPAQQPPRPQQPPTGQQPPHPQPPHPQPPPSKPPQDTPPMPTKPPEEREPGKPTAPDDKTPATEPDLKLPVPLDSFFDVFPPVALPEPPKPPVPPAPVKEACGFTSKKLLRTVESGWRAKKADAVALPGRDAVVIVTWENDIHNEFEVIGPCPLDKGHAGDHQPKKIVYEKLGTLTQTESYPPGTRRPRPPAGTGLPQGGP